MSVFNTMNFVNVFDVNVSTFACYSSTLLDYLSTLLFVTIGPIVVIAIMAIMYNMDMAYIRWYKKIYRNDPEDMASGLNAHGRERVENLKNKYAVLFFLITYTILTSVSSTIAAAYACTNIDPDNVLPEGVDKYYLT